MRRIQTVRHTRDYRDGFAHGVYAREDQVGSLRFFPFDHQRQRPAKWFMGYQAAREVRSAGKRQ